MKKLHHVTVLLAFAVAGLSVTRATTIHSGNYTVDISASGGMLAITDGNNIRFGHEGVSGVAPGSGPGSVSANGSLVATFTADPGLIFDRFYFSGLIGGMTAVERGLVRSRINWQVNGGTFSGPETYDGFNNVQYAREWEITGPNTGTSYMYQGLWFVTRMYDFGNASGYYNIGASSFSVNLDSSIFVTDSGFWTSFIAPQAIGFSATYLEAPATTSSVPEAGSTMGLMFLALSGLAGVRRLAAARNSSV